MIKSKRERSKGKTKILEAPQKKMKDIHCTRVKQASIIDPAINITKPMDDVFLELQLQGLLDFKGDSTACVLGSLTKTEVMPIYMATKPIVVIGEYMGFNVVIKIKSYGTDLGEGPPYGGLEYERRIYEAFINPLIFQKFTPNLMIFIGTELCSFWSLMDASPSQEFTRQLTTYKNEYREWYDTYPPCGISLVMESLKKYEDIGSIIKVISEKPIKETISSFTTAQQYNIQSEMWKSAYLFKNAYDKNIEHKIYAVNKISSVIFQVLYTLSCLKKKGLRHNDLHPNNIAIELDTRGSLFHSHHIIYVTPYGNYAINARNSLVKIFDWDYGYSRSIGINANLMENGERDPTYGIKKNPNFDVMFFLAHLAIQSEYALTPVLSALLGWNKAKTFAWVDKWETFIGNDGDSMGEAVTTKEEIDAFNPDRLLQSKFFNLFKIKSSSEAAAMIKRRDMVFFLPGITQAQRDNFLRSLPPQSSTVFPISSRLRGYGNKVQRQELKEHVVSLQRVLGDLTISAGRRIRLETLNHRINKFLSGN